MKIGTKVKTLISGSTGTIINIRKCNVIHKNIADIKMSSGRNRYMVLSYYVHNLIELKEPKIKLKQFSAWK